jgi:hypothetical protein
MPECDHGHCPASRPCSASWSAAATVVSAARPAAAPAAAAPQDAHAPGCSAAAALLMLRVDPLLAARAGRICVDVRILRGRGRE